MLPTSESRDAIVSVLRRFVADAFRDGRQDDLQGGTRLVSSGIVDSAGVVQLVLFAENRFGVVIDDAEVKLENFDTLDTLADLIQRKGA